MGLINDNSYCDVVDLYNLYNPENLFNQMNFFTDYNPEGNTLAIRLLGDLYFILYRVGQNSCH